MVLIDKKSASVADGEPRAGADVGGCLMFLALMSFFEPEFLSVSQADTGSLGSALLLALNALKVIFALGAVAYAARSTIIDYSIISLLLLALVVGLTVAIHQGLSAALTSSAGPLCCAALALFLKCGLERHPEHLVRVASVYFVFYTVGNVVSVGLNIVGINLLPDDVYFFGGKNSIIFSGILSLLCFSLDQVMRKGRLEPSLAFCSALYAVMAYAVDSASSTVCFCALTLFLCWMVVSRHHVRGDAVKKLGMVCIGGIVLLFFLTIVASQTGLFGPLLLLMNRDVTFTGRTYIWAQAFEYLEGNYLFGYGQDAQYFLTMGTRSTDHAHCFYLNGLVRYGILYIALFAIDVIYAVRQCSHRKADVALLVECVLLFVLLFHSLYDRMPLEVYVFIRSFLIYYQGSRSHHPELPMQNQAAVPLGPDNNASKLRPHYKAERLPLSSQAITR